MNKGVGNVRGKRVEMAPSDLSQHLGSLSASQGSGFQYLLSGISRFLVRVVRRGKTIINVNMINANIIDTMYLVKTLSPLQHLFLINHFCRFKRELHRYIVSDI